MGSYKDFSVSTVWNDMRSSSDLVPWSRLVWLSQCLGTHSFYGLLFLEGSKLMTLWDIGREMIICIVCFARKCMIAISTSFLSVMSLMKCGVG